MSTFKEKCEQYFGTTDFYEVLSVSKDATGKDSKFLVISLMDLNGFRLINKFGKNTDLVHTELSAELQTPNIFAQKLRSLDYNKGKLLQNFSGQRLTKFFAILDKKDCGPVKKAYHRLSLLVHPDRVDEAHKEVATEKFKVLGRIHSILQDKDKRKIYDDCGDFDDEADSTFNWKEYWFSMFKKIEISDIQKYEKEYIGSETERRDIKRAYEASKGNMDIILELVPFSNCETEDRIIEIVREMVNDGEVEEYSRFFNENKAKKLRRHKKWEKERKEAELINMKELEKEMEANMKRRGEAFSDLIANLEQKYAPKKARKSITDGTGKKTKKSRQK